MAIGLHRRRRGFPPGPSGNTALIMAIDETGSTATGPGSSSRRLGAAFLGLLHSHVELFGIELQEQKARTVSLLLFAGLALAFALLLLVGLSTLVMIVFWDTYRLPAIIALCVFYVLACIFCAIRLRAAIFDESSPFHGTLEELANDRERLLP